MPRSITLKHRRLKSFSSKAHRLTRSQKRRRFLIVLTALASFFLFLMVAGSLVSMVVFAFYSKDLPSPNKLVTRKLELSTKLFDRNGKLLYDVYGEKNRTLVRLEDVSEPMIKATLAAEDAEFYRHRGFDALGMVRAFGNILIGKGLQGGSTITQQLVKNALLTSERTIPRKIKEFILALQIESRYSKEEILQMYLNEAPYGGQAWGIEAASQLYFGKPARELNLAEAALLAGLPQSPTLYSPFGPHPENAKERQSYILHLMRKGWLGADGAWHKISEEEAEMTKNAELVYAPQGTGIEAPHFVMYVKSLLVQRYGEDLVERGGLQVTTTLDLEKHKKMQEIVAEEVAKAEEFALSNGALVAMDPRTGEILSMVGSRDYFDKEKTDGNVNVALALRQPGSSIKPINYVTAFKQGYTASTMVMDVKTEFPGGIGQPPYVPKNYDGRFRGPVQFRYALGNSINVAAVKVLGVVGIQNMLDTAHDMGITSLNEPDRYGLSLTLGGGEVTLLDMATAYSTFASMGVYHEPVAILRVVDSKGKVLDEFRPRDGRRALKEEYAYLVADILSDPYARAEAFGLQTPLNIPGHKAAVKTGTTDDLRDNWTLGFTPSLVIGVWVGNNDNSEMRNVASGITGAAPIWNRAMAAWLVDKENEWYPRPSGITEMTVDKLSGEVPRSGEVRLEIFVKGTEPTPDEASRVYERVEVCKADVKLANDVCKKLNMTEEQDYIHFKDIKPEWQPFVDKWIDETYPGDPKYHPPTEHSTAYLNALGGQNEREEPLVLIKKPKDGEVVDKKFDAEVEVLSPYPVVWVQFYWDDDLVGSPITSIPYTKTFKLKGTDPGEYELQVVALDAAGNEGKASVEVIVED